MDSGIVAYYNHKKLNCELIVSIGPVVEWKFHSVFQQCL